MAARHGFCSIHRIAYNRELDYYCPQCMLAHMGTAQQLDYDTERKAPVDPQSGTLLDAFTLAPVK